MRLLLQLVLFALAIALSTAARADDQDPLKDHQAIYDKAKELYARGHSQNRIRYRIMHSSRFRNIGATVDYLPFEPNLNQIAATLNDCVMLREGTDGDHLSVQEQKDLGFEFRNYLLTFDPANTIRFFRVTPPSPPIPPRPGETVRIYCSLAVEKNGWVLLLTGVP